MILREKVCRPLGKVLNLLGTGGDTSGPPRGVMFSWVTIYELASSDNFALFENPLDEVL